VKHPKAALLNIPYRAFGAYVSSASGSSRLQGIDQHPAAKMVRVLAGMASTSLIPGQSYCTAGWLDKEHLTLLVTHAQFHGRELLLKFFNHLLALLGDLLDLSFSSLSLDAIICTLPF
jgi:hypothetical protein